MNRSDDQERVTVYMRVYVSDFLTDTSDLSAEEFGAYTRLLFECWKREGELPRDPQRLARLAGVDTDTWSRVWLVIGKFFSVSPDDRSLTQKRLSEELSAARMRKATYVSRASKGGVATAERRQGVLFEPTPPPVPSPESASSGASSTASSGASSTALSKVQGFKGSSGSKAHPAQGLKGSSGKQSAHARALAAFLAVWAAEYGEQYHPTPSDNSNLGRLLRSLPEPDSIPWPAVFRRYLDDRDKFIAENHRHSLAWFCTGANGVNKYRTTSRTNGYAAKDIQAAQAVAAFAERATTNGRHR